MYPYIIVTFIELVYYLHFSDAGFGLTIILIGKS